MREDTSSRNGLLLCSESGGELVTHADLSTLSEKGHPWNEIVIDGRGNTLVRNARAPSEVKPTIALFGVPDAFAALLGPRAS